MFFDVRHDSLLHHYSRVNNRHGCCSTTSSSSSLYARASPQNRLPLFVDLLGTAYVPARGEIKEQRPAPLRHAHVQAFRNRIHAGLGGASPDELERILQNATEGGTQSHLPKTSEGDSALFAKIGPHGAEPLERPEVDEPMTRSGEATRNEIAVAHEFFINDTDHDINEVAISSDTLDFGFVIRDITCHGGGGGAVGINLTVPRRVVVKAPTPIPLLMFHTRHDGLSVLSTCCVLGSPRRAAAAARRSARS